MESKTVALHTLGCRLNMSETGTIAQGFSERGYKVVPFGEKADVVLVNTCTVTDSADSTCRNLIRKAHRSSPEGKIVVVGCYSQMEPEAVAAIVGVDLVLGTAEKYKVFDYLDEEKEQIVNVDMTNEFWGAATTPADSHTRAFLKIQDGCNYICSFCIIPQARGRSRAIRMDEAIESAKKLVGNGYKEIVLTGVNIGEYEKASGTPLYKLVQGLLRIDGLERFRLSSVEPNTFDNELIAVLKDSPKTMNHFHIPLQSGNDEVLTRMRRKYTIAQYSDILGKIKEAFPLAGIGADIILGHPGETNQQFLDTFNFLRKSPITHFHPFPYSKRKGTLSSSMDDHIPHGVKKERVKMITNLGKAKLLDFSHEQIGTTSKVLFEKRDGNFFEGYTSNFVRVWTESSIDITNQIKTVALTNLKKEKLFGEISD
ncbi:MAG: tRNA (N(6)-L-threonylcarbamoyladenosine(37)-C(2))-methylthiotransferase MtaB [Epsilonproteobacteria bacterium]|nr:MAG: tRNA (N(6)-L-threonylcarbamoyladenosine(37)-C(2))-methylthiotransferase MtaB [Campylobacterota bacterium]RLA67955.1 MAG: tRNA (N(6)-L-threonylcarbamoyladenosine(37)-C(2))-methylthiotransferase MtaB [Campylobacterota bacterium]